MRIVIEGQMEIQNNRTMAEEPDEGDAGWLGRVWDGMMMMMIWGFGD